jgi:hypothetical protein
MESSQPPTESHPYVCKQGFTSWMLISAAIEAVPGCCSQPSTSCDHSQAHTASTLCMHWCTAQLRTVAVMEHACTRLRVAAMLSALHCLHCLASKEAAAAVGWCVCSNSCLTLYRLLLTHLPPSVAQMNAQCTPKRVLVLQSVLKGIALLQ